MIRANKRYQAPEVKTIFVCSPFIFYNFTSYVGGGWCHNIRRRPYNGSRPQCLAEGGQCGPNDTDQY